MALDEVTKARITKRIAIIENEEELSDYLQKVAETLTPPVFEDETISLLDAMLDVLKPKEKSRFNVRLQNPLFQKMNEFFWLTSGLHVIAAPSAHGKTFWATQWAIETAKQDHSVLFMSLEMTPEDLAMRNLSEISGIAIDKFILDEITEKQRSILKELSSSQGYLKNIYIDKFGSLSWKKIYPKLWNHVIRLKPKLVIIDYVQMISDDDEKDFRSSAVLSNIARQLKLFADKTDSAVLLLSQMNRQALTDIKKQKWDKIGYVPLSHEYVKESGGIVEAADSVQIVCIPDRFAECPVELRCRFQITVDKSRRIGKLRTVLMPFDSAAMKFL